MTEPSFLSILPPLVAILLGFLTKQVFLSLFVGIWLGAFFLSDFRLLPSFLSVIDTHILNALADKDHAAILIFTLLIGAVTNLIRKNGGTAGLVEWFSRKAVGTRNVQLMTWLMGMAIFFDDYANTLIVGKSMRPLFDRFKISREKLAFIVDATAAPISSVALISTWVSTEIGLIGDAIADIPGMKAESPFTIFIESLPYRFYPWLMLFFVFFIIWTRRDFSKMYRAEVHCRNQKATTSHQADTNERISSPFNAVIPLVFLIIATIISLYVTGANALGASTETGIGYLRDVFGNANAYVAMLWSSLLALVFTLVISISQKLMSLTESMEGIVEGFESMMIACSVLVLAWALGAITKELKTTEYLLALLSGKLSPNLLPFLIFITSALISFATGTSWGTMAILMPIAIPLSYGISLDSGLSLDLARTVLIASAGAVLAGSVFGDHCSPISDTTVMSASSSGCDLMDHVNTQLPYALVVGLVATVIGDLSVGLGLSPFIGLGVGALCLVGLIYKFGRVVGD